MDYRKNLNFKSIEMVFSICYEKHGPKPQIVSYKNLA